MLPKTIGIVRFLRGLGGDFGGSWEEEGFRVGVLESDISIELMETTDVHRLTCIPEELSASS